MKLHLNKILFKDAVRVTADQLSLPPEFVEKDYWVTFPNGGKRRQVKKYSMATRFVDSNYKDVFKPDHDTLWYFRSKESAEWLIGLWKKQDKNGF